MSLIPEKFRLDVADFLSIADNDSRTAGVLIVMVAPTTEGWSRDMVLAHGQLDVQPALAHVVDITVRALQQHARSQEARS